jgi:hypothetical protein
VITGSTSDGMTNMTISFPGFATPLSHCNDPSRLVLIQYHGPEGFYVGAILDSTQCGVCQIAITASGGIGSHIVGTFSGTIQQENGSNSCDTSATASAVIDGSFDAIREDDGT